MSVLQDVSNSSSSRSSGSPVPDRVKALARTRGLRFPEKRPELELLPMIHDDFLGDQIDGLIDSIPPVSDDLGPELHIDDLAPVRFSATAPVPASTRKKERSVRFSDVLCTVAEYEPAPIAEYAGEEQSDSESVSSLCDEDSPITSVTISLLREEMHSMQEAALAERLNLQSQLREEKMKRAEAENMAQQLQAQLRVAQDAACRWETLARLADSDLKVTQALLVSNTASVRQQEQDAKRELEARLQEEEVKSSRWRESYRNLRRRFTIMRHQFREYRRGKQVDHEKSMCPSCDKVRDELGEVKSDLAAARTELALLRESNTVSASLSARELESARSQLEFVTNALASARDTIDKNLHINT